MIDRAMLARTAMLPGLVALLGAAGCLDVLGPDVGPARPSTCTGTDSDPARAVHFQADLLRGVFARAGVECARCHTPGGADPVGVRESGFDISTYQSFRAGGARSGTDVVIPGDPCASILVQKLGDSPPFGARMPRNGPPYLTPTELRQVEDWIAEGARDD